MPYKHIAAHLNKTDLACRLHYYQIHGNRRKRNLSCSSVPGHFSLEYGHNFPPSPPESASPSIPGSPRMDNAVCISQDIRLPPILPRPSSLAESSHHPFPTAEEARRVPLPPLAVGHAPVPFAHQQQQQRQELRLDTSFTSINSSRNDPSSVDLARLQSIYARHGQAFWGVISAEYGSGASATVLEQAWKASGSCQPVARPITPVDSPMSISSIVGFSAEKPQMWELPMEKVPEEGRNP
jgi:hypothetical protein